VDSTGKIVDLIHLLKGDFGKERISNFNKNFHSFFSLFVAMLIFQLKLLRFGGKRGVDG
jgi:hypothetical protein